MKNQKFLTFAKHMISLAIILVSIGLVLLVLFIPLFYSFRQPILDFVSQHANPADSLYIQEKLFSDNLFIELLSLILPIIEIAITLFFLINGRKLLTNVMADQIFIVDNVLITKKVSLSMLIVSLLPTIEDGDLTLININFIFLTAALVIWVFSLVLEKANHIALENQFTV